MGYIIQIAETENQPVLSVRTKTSVENLPNIVGEVFGSIAGYIAANGDEPFGPAFIAYYNLDVENLEVEIGFPVAREMEGKAEIKRGYIPAGKKAIGFHKGSYRELSSLYDRMTSWLKERGLTPAGIVYEYYYNSPGEIPESELLTKVEFLLN